MMINQELNKAIDLQEELGNPFVVIHKPNNKNSIKVYDTDQATFDIVNNELMFDFWDIEGFNIKLDKIKSVSINIEDDGTTISHINLKNGNTIMLHFMKKQ